MIRHLSILILCFYASFLAAQSEGLNSLHMIDIYNHNVAYAGFDNSLSANFNYRSQWAGIDGQPDQLYFNVHLPVYLINGGVGMSLSTDRSGALSFTNFQISYNRVRSFDYGIISMGVSAGFRQSSVDGRAIRTPEGIYIGGFSHEDPILFIDSQSGIQPIWSAALFTRTDYFDLGISAKNVFRPQSSIAGIDFKHSQVFDLYGAIPFFVSDLEIQASLYIKSNFKKTQSNVSLVVKSGNIFGGLSLRGFNENSIDSAVVLGGIRLNQHYTLSYSYDIGLSALSDYTQGSHEININYNLNKLIGIGLAPEVIYNPRDL